jgi:hypothetical protein
MSTPKNTAVAVAGQAGASAEGDVITAAPIPDMPDEYHGQGGSYLRDPETGERVLIERTGPCDCAG